MRPSKPHHRHFASQTATDPGPPKVCFMSTAANPSAPGKGGLAASSHMTLPHVSSFFRHFSVQSPPASSSSSSSSSSSPASSASGAPVSSNFRLFPHNPSIGLWLLTPIVPASDNTPALFFLTSMQLLGGMYLMGRRRPRIGEPRLLGRFLGVSRFLIGSGLVLLSGLEYTRMLLPYDPWFDEARHWRNWAIKNGHKPTWWFGAISYYSPMTMDEWKARSIVWVRNTANALEADPKQSDSLLESVSVGPRAQLKKADANTYMDIYNNLRQINARKSKELLEGSLADVSENNKGPRLDAIIEGNSDVSLNDEYIKPSIQLGSHSMETDDDFDMVWANFEPWEEIGQETDFDIRLIPRCRLGDE